MTNQEKTGWGIIAIVLLLFWWLSNNTAFLHGTTTSVQTTMKTPGGDVIQQNAPTVCDNCS